MMLSEHKMRSQVRQTRSHNETNEQATLFSTGKRCATFVRDISLMKSAQGGGHTWVRSRSFT